MALSGIKWRIITPGPPGATNIIASATVDGVSITFDAQAGLQARLLEDGVDIGAIIDVSIGGFSRPNVTPGQHVYQVVIVDAGTGLTTPSATFLVIRPLKPMPVGLVAENHADRIDVGWEATAGASGYRLAASRDLDVDTGKLDDAGDPVIAREIVPETINLAAGVLEYVDTTSLPGRLTTYTLVALDGNGFESEPATAAGTRLVTEDVQAPAPPYVVSATYAGATIVITLLAHAVPGVVYEIQRREAGAGPDQFVTVADDVSGSATSWTDTTVNPLLGYDYRLRAVLGELSSPWASIDARPPVVPAPPDIDDLYVNKATGSDSNDGETAATPFKTIAKAMSKLRPGVTVIIEDGTYTGESIIPQISGTLSKPITIKARNVGGVILDGNLTLARAIDCRNRSHIDLGGFTERRCFSGYGPADCAIVLGSFCTARDIIGEDNVGGTFGIASVHHVSYYRCIARRAGMDGWQAARCTDLLYEDCKCFVNGFGHALNEARFLADTTNSYELVSPGKWGKRAYNETAKKARCRRIVYRRYECSGNRTLDDWLDIDLIDVLYEDCTLGVVAVEISEGPVTFRRCRVRWLGVWESRLVLIEHCTIGTQQSTQTVLELRQSGHKRSFIDHETNIKHEMDLRDITVMRNTILGGYPKSEGTGYGDMTTQAFARRIVIDHNTYAPQPGGIILYWGGYTTGRCYNISQANRKGFEINGKMVTT